MTNTYFFAALFIVYYMPCSASPLNRRRLVPLIVLTIYNDVDRCR